MTTLLFLAGFTGTALLSLSQAQAYNQDERFTITACILATDVTAPPGILSSSYLDEGVLSNVVLSARIPSSPDLSGIYKEGKMTSSHHSSAAPDNIRSISSLSVPEAMKIVQALKYHAANTVDEKGDTVITEEELAGLEQQLLIEAAANDFADELTKYCTVDDVAETKTFLECFSTWTTQQRPGIIARRGEA